jgi:hypothetical protein
MSDPEDEAPPRDAVPRALILILIQEGSFHRQYSENRIGTDGYDDVVASIARSAAADSVNLEVITATAVSRLTRDYFEIASAPGAGRPGLHRCIERTGKGLDHTLPRR